MAIDVVSAPGTADGWITSQSTIDWSLAREAGTGVADHNDGVQPYAIRSRRVASGRGTQWRVTRAFFTFRTLYITQTPVAGTLNIAGYRNETANMRVVRSEHSATLANGDFNSVTGWTTGDNSGNVRYYDTGEITTWNTLGYNSIALNQYALSQIASGSSFKLCLIEATYDLTDTEPGLGVDIYNGCYFEDDTSGRKDPYITIEPDNTTFFGANF